MFYFCASCGLKVEKWEISEDEWNIVRGTEEQVICGYCNMMLEEFTFEEFTFLVLCEMCGHLCYECDTLILNEIVVCEDCRDFRDAGSRYVVESPDTSEYLPTNRSVVAAAVAVGGVVPDTSEYLPTSRSRVHKKTERPKSSPADSSPTPPNEKTEVESKDLIRATDTGSLQTSIEGNQGPLSRESRKDKEEERVVELSGKQAVPPLAKQQEHKQRGNTRARKEGRPQSPVARNTVRKVWRTDSKQRRGKGCFSLTALMVLGSLAVVLLPMYIAG